MFNNLRKSYQENMPISTWAIAFDKASYDTDTPQVRFGYLTNARKSLIWLPTNFTVNEVSELSTMGCGTPELKRYISNLGESTNKKNLNTHLPDFINYLFESTANMVAARTEMAYMQMGRKPIAGDINNALAHPSALTEYETLSWNFILKDHMPQDTNLIIDKTSPWVLRASRPMAWDIAYEGLQANLDELVPEDSFLPLPLPVWNSK